ncbi:MAG: sigma factor-like helix-turn-helix DNA-binding protein [Microbacterium sp.]
MLWTTCSTAPATVAADDDDIARMIRAARREARPPVRRPATIAVGAGLVALIVGGAGIATASSDWLWNPVLDNADRSYTYTASTWGQCEIRFSSLDVHNPFIQADVDRIIDEWFARTDVEAAAAPYVDGVLAQLEADQAALDQQLTDPRIADLTAWTAHEQALGEALFAELAAHGYDVETGVFGGAEAHSQVHCDGEDWGGTPWHPAPIRSRRRCARRRLALADRIRRQAPIAVAPPSDEGIDVRDAIARLDADLAELIRLVHGERLSLVDAAELLGIPASTARGRYAKAKKELRAMLGVGAGADVAG